MPVGVRALLLTQWRFLMPDNAAVILLILLSGICIGAAGYLVGLPAEVSAGIAGLYGWFTVSAYRRNHK